MAKNYTIAEAVKVFAKNDSPEEIMDLGRRYPLLANLLARLTAVAPKEAAEFAGYLPEYLSANKVNMAMKKTVGGDDAEDADDADDAEEKKPVKKAAKKGRPAKKAETEEEEEGSDYDDMGAPELFKECKKRGIKAAPKKPAKYYADLLKKADAESDEDAEDDDWGDDEGDTEEEAPKKKAAAKDKDKKPSPKKKVVDDDDDDDDDWDI